MYIAESRRGTNNFTPKFITLPRRSFLVKWHFKCNNELIILVQCTQSRICKYKQMIYKIFICKISKRKIRSTQGTTKETLTAQMPQKRSPFKVTNTLRISERSKDCPSTHRVDLRALVSELMCEKGGPSEVSQRVVKSINF